MNSFDLWGTLVAGFEPSVRDGDQAFHFPVAENLARVRGGDLVLSDFYDTAKAQRVLRDVCGLNNELMVTVDGKFTGTAWETLQRQGRVPQLHIGDDPCTDYAVPRNHGVVCEMSHVKPVSQREQMFIDRGFHGLARIMRESRLATWHEDETMRALQVFQSQCNLPFLFLAWLAVMRKTFGTIVHRVMFSARDCWLWMHLAEALNPGGFEFVYFYTSRLTRYWPSLTYLQYLKRMQSVPSLIVDLCGFGKSLSALLEHPKQEALLLVGYEGCELPCIISGWMNEVTNFARHPMIADVDADGSPVYVNPLGIEWEKVEGLRVMHEAFLCGVEAVKHYNFADDFSRTDEEVIGNLKLMLSDFDLWERPLATLTELRVTEAIATSRLLLARNEQEHGSIEKEIVI